jgi:hypothetical protein
MLRRTPKLIEFKSPWFVIIAFIMQFIGFQFPVTRSEMSRELASSVLIGSQILLLVFAWLNRQQTGMWIMGLGLLLNLFVIIVNGGLMPISPETVQQMVPDATAGTWQVGQRFGTGKDIVLTTDNTRFWCLGDRYLLPGWFPYKAAFSIGDILIAIGGFWLFWSIGSRNSVAVRS